MSENTSSLSSRFKAEFVGQIVAAAVTGSLTVILARLLDPEGYGSLFLAISVLGTIEIFSRMGVGEATARYITEYNKNDRSQVRHILLISFKFIALTVTISAIVLLLTYDYIAAVLEEPDLAVFLLLGTLFVIFSALTAYTRAILQAFELIRLSAYVVVSNKVTTFVLAIGFVLLGFEALGAFSGYVIGVGVAAALGFSFVLPLFFNAETTAPREPGLKRRIGRYAVPLTVTSAADVIDKRVDVILVGLFINPLAVSYYYIANQIVYLIAIPVEALGFTLAPMYGSKKAERNLDQAARIYENVLVHALLLYIPAAAGLTLLAEPVIDHVFGVEYAGAVPVLQVLSIYAILVSINYITSQGLNYLGKARSRAIVKSVTSLLNFVLNLLLIPLFGVVGAAVATVFTYSIYTFTNLYLIYGEFGLDFLHVLRNIVRIALITGVMSIVVFFVVNAFGGVISLIAAVFTGVAVWFVLSVITGLLDVRAIAARI